VITGEINCRITHIMGNKQCNAKPQSDTGVLSIRYAVPAVFTLEVQKAQAFAQTGGKDSDRSPQSVSDEEHDDKHKDKHKDKDKKEDWKDPQTDPDAEPEEPINDEETDNIIIEDDEMNELFEEDLDADDAAVDREAVDDAIKGSESEQSGGLSSAVSSSSPYGHGKRLAESSSALLPMYDTNSV
jgi:hypothetical protein